jgi:hypothetical protein
MSKNDQIIQELVDKANPYFKEFNKLHDFLMEIEVAFGFTRGALPFATTFTERQYIIKIEKTGTEYTKETFAARIDQLQVERIVPYTIVSLVSLFEDYFFELVKHLVINVNPHPLIGNNKVDAKTIFTASDIATLRNSFIDIELDKIKRQNVFDWFKFLRKIINVEFAEDQKIQLSEIVCSRNIFIHNSNIINQIYVEKSGKFARHAIGEKNVMDVKYFAQSLDMVNKLMVDLLTNIGFKLGVKGVEIKNS